MGINIHFPFDDLSFMLCSLRFPYCLGLPVGIECIMSILFSLALCCSFNFQEVDKQKTKFFFLWWARNKMTFVHYWSSRILCIICCFIIHTGEKLMM